MLKFALLISIFFVANFNEINAATDKVVCYYASWGSQRPGNGKFVPEDIDANSCTHVNYAFVGLEDDGRLKILDQATDIDQEGFKRVSALKQKNPNLKCLFSVGGYTAGTAIFSAVSADPAKRANMAASALEFFETYNYDGLDIDWEYPEGGDLVNYISMLQDLKNAFQSKGYLLTVAVNHHPTDGVVYDVPSMSKILDIINVMTYDYHGSWTGSTVHHSPLYGSASEGEWQRDNLNANSSITHWIQAGATAGQLCVGSAFYGHAFTLSDPNNHGMGAPSSAAAPAGPYTANVGTLGYNEICELHSKGTTEFDDEIKEPYLYDGDLWVGYDNIQSVQERAKYAVSKNLAGVMIWSVETDDIHDFCGQGKTLVQAIKEAL